MQTLTNVSVHSCTSKLALLVNGGSHRVARFVQLHTAVVTDDLVKTMSSGRLQNMTLSMEDFRSDQMRKMEK